MAPGRTPLSSDPDSGLRPLSSTWSSALHRRLSRKSFLLTLVMGNLSEMLEFISGHGQSRRGVRGGLSLPVQSCSILLSVSSCPVLGGGGCRATQGGKTRFLPWGRTGAVVSLSFLGPPREGGTAPESMTEGPDSVLKVC